jgi:ureidoglycolate lyase
MLGQMRRCRILFRYLTSGSFTFSADNLRSPNLPSGLRVIDVPLLPTDELHAVGAALIHHRDERNTDKGNFEIVRWPVLGWRSLDPETGNEAGTTEGPFEVEWQGDFFNGRNMAINTTSNVYLDGLGAPPECASVPAFGKGDVILLWMSDYHPDGAQSFWPEDPSTPYAVCLGPADTGDDVKPSDMRCFHIPPGKGVYIKPGTWHNGIYVHAQSCPARFWTRQGRVHARVSCSWASEFGVLLRVPLPLKD